MCYNFLLFYLLQVIIKFEQQKNQMKLNCFEIFTFCKINTTARVKKLRTSHNLSTQVCFPDFGYQCGCQIFSSNSRWQQVNNCRDKPGGLSVTLLHDLLEFLNTCILHVQWVTKPQQLGFNHYKWEFRNTSLDLPTHVIPFPTYRLQQTTFYKFVAREEITADNFEHILSDGYD